VQKGEKAKRRYVNTC